MPEPQPISIISFVFISLYEFILFKINIMPSVVGWCPVPKPAAAGIIIFLVILYFKLIFSSLNINRPILMGFNLLLFCDFNTSFLIFY